MLTERIFDKVVLNVKSRDITNFSRMTWRSWYDMSQTKRCMLKLYISKAFCNLKRKTIAFFILVKTLIWFSIIKWVSIITPNSYSDDDWVILAWLNTNLGKIFCFVTKMVSWVFYPASIYLLKADKRNTRTRCEICSKLPIKTLERRYWHHSVSDAIDIILAFTVNFEHSSHLPLVFLLLTLSMWMPAG